jgi:hypothetical protein
MNKFNDLVYKYYYSDNIKEKVELKKKLLEIKTENKIRSNNFHIAVRAHFDLYKVTQKKKFLETMINLLDNLNNN